MSVPIVWMEFSGKREREVMSYEANSEYPCTRPDAYNGEHWARKVIGVIGMHWDAEKDHYVDEDDLHLDTPGIPFPTECECGYVFSENARHSLGGQTLYCLPDGKLVTTNDAPIGAMCWAPWLDRIYTPQRKHVINVKLPDGSWWTVDAQASNCGIADDHNQRRHHCWVIEGDVPNITVSKSGPTCAAGAGSIQSPHWHGFLRNGFLESC